MTLDKEICIVTVREDTYIAYDVSEDKHNDRLPSNLPKEEFKTDEEWRMAYEKLGIVIIKQIL